MVKQRSSGVYLQTSLLKFKNPRIAYILGGETTVKLNRLNNNGLEGRNQESRLALALKSKFHHTEDITILSMGTDGIDGRSDAVGGFVTPKTVRDT